MAIWGNFSCSFTRRNCTHDVVFHQEYQRTNRTKENKILRCFPHCCPEHVVRSYCGSSLHLQVDFEGGDGSAISATPTHPPLSSPQQSHDPPAFLQPTRDDDLMVFGRFRPKESRGFSIGDEIAGATILSSLQSEDNAAGEWIEAWLIASANRNVWLFEVNHSARWYYNWGSSAAKDKRLKEHVFEVYVLYQSSAGTPCEAFQVVAVSSSPPFKLLSFRRAPTELRRRGHGGAEVEKETPRTGEFQSPGFKSETETERGRGREREQRTETKWGEANWEEEEKESQPVRHAVTHESLHSSRMPPPLSPPLASARPPVWSSPPPVYRHCSDPQSRDTEPARIQPHDRSSQRRKPDALISSDFSSPLKRPRLPPPSLHHIADRRRPLLEELVLIINFLLSLPLFAALPFVPALETTFERYAGKSQRTHTTRDESSGLRHLHRTLAELQDTQRLPYLHPQLVELAAHLALWLHFDSSVLQPLESLNCHATALLLDRAALVEAHDQYVEWLHAKIDHFLRHHGGGGGGGGGAWSARAFVAEVERSGLVSISSVASQGTGVAFEDFVAAIRERFIVVTARQPQRLTLSRISSASCAGAPSLRRQIEYRVGLYDGEWHSALDGVRLRSCGPHHTLTGLTPVPLHALLWFWRQLSCVSVALAVSSSSAVASTLQIQSAFSTHSSLSSSSSSSLSSGLRLVLDGKPRWFRSFPDGTSTSAMAVGRQLLGDYRAVYDDESESVACAMYSWPIVPSTAAHKEEGEEESAAMAYCWHWQIQPVATVPGPPRSSDVSLLRVQLVVECGSLRKSDGAWRRQDDERMHTAPLAYKCARVERWQRTLVADWIMERTERASGIYERTSD